MSSLLSIEKSKFEKLFGMSSGYVLDFSDKKFGDFFADFGIDIHSSRYKGSGDSKAKKLREFTTGKLQFLQSRVEHNIAFKIQ